MSARKVSWTVSVWGRRVLRGAAVSLIGGTFIVHYLPNNLLIDKFQAITQGYSKGLPIPVPKTVQSLVQDVMGEVGVGETKGGVSLYTSVGYDFFKCGSPHSRWGALLGVPSSLKWDGEEDFDGTGIMVNNAPVPWNTEAGQKLSHSLVLSKKAKKFVIARELHEINTSDPLTKALIPTLALVIAYTTSIGINKRIDLYSKPRVFRLCLYSLASIFGYCFYVLGKDMGTVKAEEESDGKAAAMGISYAEGGVEFYKKILERNVALRKLMGSEGEKLFTAKGNDEVLFRTKHLPYTVRLDRLKEQLKKYKEENRP